MLSIPNHRVRVTNHTLLYFTFVYCNRRCGVLCNRIVKCEKNTICNKLSKFFYLILYTVDLVAVEAFNLASKDCHKESLSFTYLIIYLFVHLDYLMTVVNVQSLKMLKQRVENYLYATIVMIIAFQLLYCCTLAFFFFQGSQNWFVCILCFW
jgi:hypothetical protein